MTASTSLASQLRPRAVRLAHLMRRQSSQLPISLAQSAVLGILIDGQAHRVGELVQAEDVQVPTMTQLLTRMEAQGWVARSACQGDRRGVEVRITDLGQQLAREVMASRTALLDQRLARLSPEQRRALEAALPALDRLVEA